jgi:DNA-binding transcriptional regulator YiaG
MMTNNNRRNDKKGKNGTRVPIQNSLDQAGQLVDITPPDTSEGLEIQNEAGMTSLTRTAGPTTNEPDLGMTIRRLRESRQLSLKEVAARSGLTQSFLSQVERNLQVHQ